MKQSLRFSILQRDKFTCQYCGKAGGELEVDHVVPQSRGGSDDPGNLKTACVDCNRGKSDTPLQPIRKAKGIRYAFHIRPEDGGVDYCGKIVSRTSEMIDIEAIDAVCAFAGLWSLSGCVYSVRASECRLFTSKQAAMMTMHRINENIFAAKKGGG